MTIDDLAQWCNITVRGASVDALLTECLGAAQDLISERLGVWVNPLADGWAPRIEQAVLIQASRYYKRRQSPEGSAGWGDLGVVRIVSVDPDVEALLNNDLAFWFA